MRETQSELERIALILSQELEHDKTFLSGLLDHKNATIQWLRQRQMDDAQTLEAMFAQMQAEHIERIKALNDMYEGLADNLAKEIQLIENHLKTYEVKRK